MNNQNNQDWRQDGLYGKMLRHNPDPTSQGTDSENDKRELFRGIIDQLLETGEPRFIYPDNHPNDQDDANNADREFWKKELWKLASRAGSIIPPYSRIAKNILTEEKLELEDTPQETTKPAEKDQSFRSSFHPQLLNLLAEKDSSYEPIADAVESNSPDSDPSNSSNVDPSSISTMCARVIMQDGTIHSTYPTLDFDKIIDQIPLRIYNIPRAPRKSWDKHHYFKAQIRRNGTLEQCKIKAARVRHRNYLAWNPDGLRLDPNGKAKKFLTILEHLNPTANVLVKKGDANDIRVTEQDAGIDVFMHEWGGPIRSVGNLGGVDDRPRAIAFLYAYLLTYGDLGTDVVRDLYGYPNMSPTLDPNESISLDKLTMLLGVISECLKIKRAQDVVGINEASLREIFPFWPVVGSWGFIHDLAAKETN